MELLILEPQNVVSPQPVCPFTRAAPFISAEADRQARRRMHCLHQDRTSNSTGLREQSCLSKQVTRERLLPPPVFKGHTSSFLKNNTGVTVRHAGCSALTAAGRTLQNVFPRGLEHTGMDLHVSISTQISRDHQHKGPAGTKGGAIKQSLQAFT